VRNGAPLLYPGKCPFYLGEKGYYLAEDYSFLSYGGGVHTVPAGFWFNGASIPPAFWQLTFSPFDPDIMPHALPHDWNYCSHIVARDVADDTLWRGIESEGYDIKSRAVGLAVETFGGLFWEDSDNDRAYMSHLCSEIIRSGRSLSRYGLTQPKRKRQHPQ
jgi:hypothetical protein